MEALKVWPGTCSVPVIELLGTQSLSDNSRGEASLPVC